MPTDLWDVIRIIRTTTPFAFVGIAMLILLVVIGNHRQNYSLNGIKTKTVGNGQHGTARWATQKEIDRTYTRVPFEPEKWRRGEDRPEKLQGLILGCEYKRIIRSWRDIRHKRWKATALVDTDDIRWREYCL